jgi:hypothetical protein
MRIDPGLDGGVAMLLPDGSVRLQPTPVLPVGAGTKQNEAAAIASCARRYPDLSLLMAPEHGASPGIRRGEARSPPPWPGARRREGRHAGPDHGSGRARAARFDRDTRLDRNFYSRKSHVRQQEFDTHDDSAD